jgi:hypothetical protein
MQSLYGGTAPFNTPKNWASRGHLPHYDTAGKYQMVTYRLADSLPEEALERIERASPGSAGSLPAEETLKRRKLIERYLDRGYGSCILTHPPIAQMIIDNWKHFDGKRYDLIAYVVMPNHVHLLIKVGTTHSLAQIVHSWKSYTAHQIVNLLVNEREEATRRGEDAGEPPALPGGGHHPIGSGYNAGEPPALPGGIAWRCGVCDSQSCLAARVLGQIHSRWKPLRQSNQLYSQQSNTHST